VVTVSRLRVGPENDLAKPRGSASAHSLRTPYHPSWRAFKRPPISAASQGRRS